MSWVELAERGSEIGKKQRWLIRYTAFENPKHFKPREFAEEHWAYTEEEMRERVKRWPTEIVEILEIRSLGFRPRNPV